MHRIVDTARHYLLAWGYGAIVLGLLGEDSGLPLPGETILLFASFLAYKGEHFHLAWVMLVGVASSTLGDNLGYLFGCKAGRRLIRHWRFILHISERDLADGEELLRRHGSLASGNAVTSVTAASCEPGKTMARKSDVKRGAKAMALT